VPAAVGHLLPGSGASSREGAASGSAL
jgi:hypothetical protein